jgi:hypothetical protein
MTNVPAFPRRPGPVLVSALSRVELRLPEDSFLLSRFEEFYREMVRLKVEFSSQVRPAAATAQRGHERLAALLQKQEDDVGRTGTLLGIEMYRQSKRVMACLADEVFTEYLRAAGGHWPSLESALFHIAHGEASGLRAGGQCLKKLDQLLRQDDPVYRELAEVYFYALALGRPGNPEAENYLAALKEIVLPQATSETLFPQSYAHTQVEDKLVLLPSPKKWLWIGVWILLAWFALSWLLWEQVSSPIQEQLNQIQDTRQP